MYNASQNPFKIGLYSMSKNSPRSIGHSNDHNKSRPFIWMIPIFLGALITVCTTFFKEQTLLLINSLLHITTHHLGFLFLIYGTGCVLALTYIACSPLGQIRLGRENERPEYSFKEWLALLFCAGLGISVILWGFVESLYYQSSPPYHLSQKDSTTMEWSHMIPFFHWGISAWAIYCVPTVSLAYGYYVKKIDSLSFTALLCSIFKKPIGGIFSKMIDLIVIFCILGGMCTSIGIVIPVLSTLLGKMMGWEPSLSLQLQIIFLLSIIFSVSTCLGMDKGLKKMSLLNAYLAAFFVLFVLITGPTSFIIDISTNSLGLMISNFFRMSLYLDPVDHSGWPQNWTVFYWAWWVAYTPMMGIFVTKISKGRTIKELIVGMCFGGSLGCWSILGVLGGYSLYLEKSGTLNLTEMITEKGFDETVMAILSQLPYFEITSVFFLILAIIFTATTFDSTAYILAEMSSPPLRSTDEPSLRSRILWCFLLVLFSINILLIDAFEAIKLSSTLVAIPMIPVSIVSLRFFIKNESLRDQDKSIKKTHLTHTEIHALEESHVIKPQ